MSIKPLKQAIKAFDLFSQPATFRYGDQPQYRSVTGGLCSIIICIAFSVIFITTIISTMNRESIDYKTTISQEEDPTFYSVGSDTLMFAIGIAGVNLNQGERWFTVYFQKREYQVNNKSRFAVPLQPCERSQWAKIKQQLGKTYDNLGFSGWLCPTQDLQIELQGKYSSQMFKHYKIGVKQCKEIVNSTRKCVSNATIQKFLNANETFTFNFYYVNTIINPGNLNFTDNYLDDLNYFPFTPYDGISANFFISAYEIKTDQSLYPYEDFTYKRGGVSSATTQTINYKVRQADYLKFYIRKSSLSMKIQRSFRKVDDSLSYVGGLFSILLSLLLIMNKYNELSYEMQMAKNLYHYDKNEPLRSDQFNFFVFLGYFFYSLLRKIKITLNWKKMQIYDRSLEQVRKQMDIRLVMKKILYSQRMAIAVFDEPKAKMLHLQEPLTLEQAEQIRKDHRFYQKLESKYFDYEKIKEEEQKDNIEVPFKANLSQLINQDQGPSIETQIQKQRTPLEDLPEPQPPISILKKYNRLHPKRMDKRRRTLRQVYQIQKATQLEKRNAQKKLFHISNLFADKTKQKQDEFNSQIEQMKQYANILLKQAQNGDQVSQKILNRFDPKLMKLILSKQQKQQKQREERQSKKKIPIFDINDEKNRDNDSISSKQMYPEVKQQNFEPSNTTLKVKTVHNYQMHTHNKVSPFGWSLPSIIKKK